MTETEAIDMMLQDVEVTISDATIDTERTTITAVDQGVMIVHSGQEKIGPEMMSPEELEAIETDAPTMEKWSAEEAIEIVAIAGIEDVIIETMNSESELNLGLTLSSIFKFSSIFYRGGGGANTGRSDRGPQDEWRRGDDKDKAGKDSNQWRKTDDGKSKNEDDEGWTQVRKN